ncbi:MAG: LysR family transcriptional regulator [Pedosphaera sp.]|nr:LysR family transcriptional regulator [Pedosphaera sp.]
MFENLFSKAGLSLERLRTFAEIVEAQGFTAAARGDPTRQSQISRQLRELEEYFGVELVSRGRGRFALTPAGKALHELVRSQFNALEDLRKTCDDQPVEISLGAGESLLQWLVLPRLARVREKLPKVVWTLQNLQTEEIVARLADGRTDLGILRSEAVPKSLRSVPLGKLEFALFVPKGLLDESSPSDIGKLLGQLPLAVLEGHSQLNEVLQDSARKTGVGLNVQLCCSSLTQVAEAVQKLGFAALLPTLAKQALAPAEVETRAFSPPKEKNRLLVLGWNPRHAAIRPMLQLATKELASLLKLS